MNKIKFRVLLFQEFTKESSYIVAQTLEKDVAAQGKSFSEATRNLKTQLNSMVKIAKDRKEMPFKRLSSAPAYYHKIWENAAKSNKKNISINL